MTSSARHSITKSPKAMSDRRNDEKPVAIPQPPICRSASSEYSGSARCRRASHVDATCAAPYTHALAWSDLEANMMPIVSSRRPRPHKGRGGRQADCTSTTTTLLSQGISANCCLTDLLSDAPLHPCRWPSWLSWSVPCRRSRGHSQLSQALREVFRAARQCHHCCLPSCHAASRHAKCHCCRTASGQAP